MPIKREEYNILRQDIYKNVGIGIEIPFSEDTVFKTTYSSKDQIKSNLINYLLSNVGERPFSSFGANLRQYIFEQMVDEERLSEILIEKIYLYVPNITVNKVDVSKIEEDNSLAIQIYYSYNNTNDKIAIKIA